MEDIISDIDPNLIALEVHNERIKLILHIRDCKSRIT